MIARVERAIALYEADRIERERPSRYAPESLPAGDGALCVGASWLFEQTTRTAHERAALLCAACPAIDWCARTAANEDPSSLTGTWAGHLYGEEPHDRIAEEDAKYTDYEAKACHAAYTRGIHTDYVCAGERFYQRRAKRQARAKAAA